MPDVPDTELARAETLGKLRRAHAFLVVTLEDAGPVYSVHQRLLVRNAQEGAYLTTACLELVLGYLKGDEGE